MDFVYEPRAVEIIQTHGPFKYGRRIVRGSGWVKTWTLGSIPATWFYLCIWILRAQPIFSNVGTEGSHTTSVGVLVKFIITLKQSLECISHNIVAKVDHAAWVLRLCKRLVCCIRVQHRSKAPHRQGHASKRVRSKWKKKKKPLPHLKRETSHRVTWSWPRILVVWNGRWPDTDT